MPNKVFLDLETTGLNPAKEEILEIGFALVDENYSIIDALAMPVMSEQAEFRINSGILDKFILEMHGDGPRGSGLLRILKDTAKINRASMMPDYVEDVVLKVLDRWGVDGKTPTYGSSVGFDRKFLEQHFPTIQEKFHYRVVDSSSDMELMKSDYPALWKAIDTDPSKAPYGSHSVMSDIMYSIDVQRRIDKWVFRPAHNLLIATSPAGKYNGPETLAGMYEGNYANDEG